MSDIGCPSFGFAALWPVFGPLGVEQRAIYHNGPEALFAVAAAFAAKGIVSNAVAVIEEKGPFPLALLAHSRHGGSFLCLFPGVPG